VNAMDTEVLLHTYDRLSATTGHMLCAAQSGDWERLVTLERDCGDIVARLSALETEDPLPVGISDRKAALIRKVLADDAAIRDITEPQLKRLSHMLDANRSEQRLLRAYGPPPIG
jgi:flagellar protein FliT